MKFLIRVLLIICSFFSFVNSQDLTILDVLKSKKANITIKSNDLSLFIYKNDTLFNSIKTKDLDFLGSSSIGTDSLVVCFNTNKKILVYLIMEKQVKVIYNDFIVGKFIGIQNGNVISFKYVNNELKILRLNIFNRNTKICKYDNISLSDQYPIDITINREDPLEYLISGFVDNEKKLKNNIELLEEFHLKSTKQKDSLNSFVNYSSKLFYYLNDKGLKEIKLENIGNNGVYNYRPLYINGGKIFYTYRENNKNIISVYDINTHKYEELYKCDEFVNLTYVSSFIYFYTLLENKVYCIPFEK